jgi:hypothetical protein
MSQGSQAARRRVFRFVLATALVGGVAVVLGVRFAPHALSRIKDRLRHATGSTRQPGHTAKNYDPGYDPARDPARDLQFAVDQARRERKRILVIVGGRWCSWCGKLAQTMKAEAEVAELQSEHFVTVKVNFSPENENEAFLSRFPRIEGYPHIFVLSPDGLVLHSQDTDELLEGKSYSREKLTRFLEAWVS